MSAGKSRGRYSEKIASEILERMACGESLRVICKDDHAPGLSTVLRWVSDDHEGFQARYTLAMDLRAQAIFEEMIELADSALGMATGAPGTGEAGAKVAAIKLSLHAREWVLSRMAPKRYGTKLSQEISGPDGAPIGIAATVRPAEEVANFTGELYAGFMEFRDGQGNSAELNISAIGSFSEVIANFARFDESASRPPREVGAFFARAALIASKVRAPASFRGMGSEE